MVRSRYPRPGHRLAPVALRELLEVPVPRKYFQDGESPGMLLSDLDETAWERFSEETCRHLGEEIVRTIGRAARLPIPIGECRLPPIPDGMTLADLDLEVRTINCLVAVGIHERPQDLQTMTIEGVLGFRGFWVKSLVDLLTSLEYVTEHPEARKALRTDAIVAIKHLRAAHRYPRPNHRLAPQALKELLLDRIPPALVRGTPFRKARLCDLDETAWEHLDPSVIGHLAGLIVMKATGAVHHPAIVQRHLPQPPENMRLEDLRLENRTHNCLLRDGYGQSPQDLGKLTIGELLSTRAFGSKCLVDLLSSLETRVGRDGTLNEDLTAEAKALGDIPQAAKLQFTDPRLGRLLRAIDTESNSVPELVQRLLKRRVDPPDPVHLCRQIRELCETIGRLSELPLEEELIQIFAPSSSERDRQIVAEYYGWDGEGGHTLEELGTRYGLSRERIRQVCVRAIKRNRDTVVFAPVLDRAMQFLSERFPIGLDRLQADFEAKEISTKRLTVEAVQQAAGFLGRDMNFEIIDVGRSRLAVLPKHTEIPRMISHAAKQAVTNYGAARISEVLDELTAKLDKRIDPALVRETLQTRDDFCWLDERRNWFRLDVLPQYGLPNMVEKVLSVAEQIDVSKLRTAMGRYRRNGRKLPPPKILLEFCRQMPKIRIEGNTVVSDPLRDWRKTLAGVERKMVQVLKEHGPIMERTAFEDHCIALGMNRFSFNAIVMCSPVVEQFGRSIYGLVGSKADKKRIAELLTERAGGTPSRVLKSFGQTAGGQSYLAYRLSKAAISGGVITVPAAMKQQVRGKFTLRTDQGHKLGTLVAKKGCGWGLGPALRGNDAKQGDHLLIVFDTAKRDARIRIGDETVLDDIIDT